MFISAALGVRLWELAEYTTEESRLPPLIDPDWIQNHLGITTVSIGNARQKAWATIDIAKVRCIIHGTNKQSVDRVFSK